MLKRAVIDTGPLVAIAVPTELAHTRCVQTLSELRPPLITCWPVLTEFAWLVRKQPGALRTLESLISNGVIQVAELDRDALSWCIRFMERYADIGAQLADAALMWLAEREGIETVFTLDRRDFTVYRTTRGRALELVPYP